MADKVHRIHTLPDGAPWTGGLPPAGSGEHPMFVRMLDRVLAIQRPVVVAHLRSIRLRHPNATTVEIVRILEPDMEPDDRSFEVGPRRRPHRI